MRPFKTDKIPSAQTTPDLTLWMQQGNFDLEIGAGQGLHAIRYAKANPNRRLLAIERTSDKFEKLHGRYQKHQELTNLFPLHADAISVVTHLITENYLERVFLLYPNPYPKAKQRNQRWYNSPFMECLKARMKSEAQFFLSTNIDWYAKEALASLTKTWGFHLLSDQKISDPQLAQTHFEKKYLLRGELCHRMVFEKL